MWRSGFVFLLALLFASVQSFVPSTPVCIFRHRLASSVQVQTLSDESSATEESVEATEPQAAETQSAPEEPEPELAEVSTPVPVGEEEESSATEESVEAIELQAAETQSAPEEHEPELAEASTEVPAGEEEQEETVVESVNGESDEAPPPPKRKVERVRHTVFVGNLPYDTTEGELREHFSAHGTVQLINLPKDRMTGSPRGFAFIDFASAEEMDTVVEALNEVELRDRPLRVAKSLPQDKLKKPRDNVNAIGEKLYVGNLPFDITNDEIKEFFAEYGEAMDVFIPLGDNGRGRGFAFVTVKSEDTEKIIAATNGYYFEGRSLVVNKPLPPGQKAPRKFSARKKIYIGNLSFDTISETIESLFGEFGEVLDCYLPRDLETGSSRGFGFVSMAPEAADAAIYELDGCEVDGRVIRVNEAMDKKDVTYAMKSEDDDYA